MEDLTGKSLGPYHIITRLSEGGMATVYEAFQPTTGRYVALKVLPPHLVSHRSAVERFRQEAKVLAHLQHPHILSIFDFGEADGYAYIVMPLLTSGTLTDHLLQSRPLPLKQILQVISQIGDALDYAHARGIIHRDVKPSNILIDERGNCVLSDFGLTKLVGATNLTTTGTITGTPAYMSPEQGLGERIDGRSDIYSLGVILYEMATGRVPYKAETPMAVVIKHINSPLPPPRTINPSLPAAVERVILKALAKRREDRYATAGEMVRALQAALADTEAAESTVEMRAGARSAQRTSPAEKPKAPLPMWASVVGGAALIGVAAALFALFGAGNPAYLPALNRGATQTWAAAAAGRTTPAPPNVSGTAGGPNAALTPHSDAATPAPTLPPSPMPGPGATHVSPKDQMVEAYVPAGEFTMGSPASDQNATPYERPQRTVYLDAFWIDRTEVTNAMWAVCVQADVCRPPGSLSSATHIYYYGNANFNDYPVIYVSWNDAKGYCTWAGRRLPTEAEWEKAARGTDGRLYPWGAILPSASRANFNAIKGDTTAVGSYPASASPYGALDMAGNVVEWVSDWYSGVYYPDAPATNPQGPEAGTARVLRGGAWNSSGAAIRAASRVPFEPISRYNFIGFRCAR